MKKTKWIAVCMVAMMVLFAAGCKNSTDPDLVAVEKVSLNTTTLTLTINSTATLEATVEPVDAYDKTVKWSSSKDEVATVENGTVTAVAAGTATITAEAGGKKAECEITVTSATVESVDVSKKKLPLEVGVMEKLDVRILPAEAAGVTVTWSSSKEAVATVGNDGTVKAIKVGTAIITAQAGDKTDTCEVTVSTHSHYYVNWKCTTCGLDKPSFKEGDIDDWGNLTAYTGSGTTVEIPKGVTCIGSEVFKDCTSLTSVTIPDGTTRIKSSAFKGCTGLTSVTLPDSVTNIGSDAFSGCTSLKEIQFNGTMEEWKAIDGSDDVRILYIECKDGYIGVKDAPAYLKFDGTRVTGYTDGLPADLTIPNGTTKIGEEAFKDCKPLTSVTLPDTVTNIGYDAFYGCTGLTSVTIGDGVTEIGRYAFKGCTDLTTVTLGNGMTEIGYEAFYGCTSLKEIQFKGTVEQWKAINGSDDVRILYIECKDGYIGVKDAPAYLKISEWTVTGYTDEIPTDLIIPDGVTAIKSVSFYNCTRLESVTIPTSVTSIANCGNRNYDFNRGAFENCTNLTSVTINNGMESIGSYAFAYCTKLTSVTIPDSVTSIGEYAFSGCTSLKEIQFKGTVEQWNAIDGINDITIPCIVCNDGYIGIKDLPAYLIVSGTTVTGYTDEVPENLVIPEGLTSINGYAFKGCTKLTSVTIPKSMTNIKGAAFHNCTSLTDITFLDSVTTIEDSPIFLIGAFEGCTKLKTVTMGNGVIKIGSYAFKGCTSLTTMTIPDSVTSIGSSAFSGCTSLTDVAIPDSVTSIGSSAFSGCTSLTDVAIPDRVTSIGEYAFSRCTSLTDVAIPDRVTSIGEYAFYECTNLTTVTIPDSVRKIGKFAFYGCTKLTTITIPVSVTSIGSYAFNSCTSLKNVNYGGTKEEWEAIKIDTYSGLSSKTIIFANE